LATRIFQDQCSVYNASVKVSYTFDVFGAIHRQIEGYEAQAEYQKYQLEAAFLTLASNIVTTVIQEAALHALIDATEAIIAAQREQLTVIQQQFELGSVSNAPVLAQQAAIEQTRTSIPPLQKQLAHAQHRLAVLVGDLPHSGTETRFTLTDLHLPEQLPLSLPAKLLEQRPDVQAQAAALHAASAQIGVVAASIFPDFTISANVSSIATNAGDLFLPDSLIWGLGANLLQPIFHGGEFTHKKRAAVAAYEQAAAHYHSTVLQAFQNVADSLSALEFDTDELNAQDAAERASYASLELTRSQFQMGAVSYITLLSAQRDYQQIKIGQIKAQALRYADTAALFQALGGGWWNRDIFSTAVSTTKAKTTP
jgi:NodT family efflux transporter outer membrane factor (OMF) lipoprotein